MKTTEYLKAAQRKLGHATNAQTAAQLGVTEAAMSRYASGDRVMDDYTAAQIAEILGIDPIRVIAQANAEREKDAKRAAYWSRMAHASMTAASVALAVVILTVTPSPANAAPVLKTAADGFVLCKLIFATGAWSCTVPDSPRRN